MSDKRFRFGPLALTTTYTTNILNPGTTTGGTNSTSAPYDKLRIYLTHIRITNKTGSPSSFRLYIDATGGNTAGKEFMGYGKVVPANDYIDWYGYLPLDTTDFLVGGAADASALTIEGEGTIGVAN